jgi:signal transduction histidine kinase
LRTPDGIDAVSVAKFTTELLEQVDRLDLLITDLLDASRIQQGRLDLHPERVDLATLARRVVNRFSQTPEHGDTHRIRFEGPDEVVGTWDGDRLDQVLTNLVSNALKYSPDGGDVLVRLETDRDQVELSVIDQGIGIELSEQTALFQPFSRTAEARRHASGTGLGLYITRQIVELHGGTIDLVSDVGVGTTILVRIPGRQAD